jgi:hypothetical protein
LTFQPAARCKGCHEANYGTQRDQTQAFAHDQRQD